MLDVYLPIAGLTVSLLLMFFLFLGYPILAFVHCIQNPSLNKQSKIAWGSLIFFTWSLGAIIYSLVASRRPFYRNMAIACLLVGIALLIAKKPLQNYRKSLPAKHAAEMNKLDADRNASIAAEWDRYKPLYDAYGMAGLYSQFQSGHCAEGKNQIDSYVKQAMQTPQVKRSKLTEAQIRRLAERGFNLCERSNPPADPLDPKRVVTH